MLREFFAADTLDLLSHDLLRRPLRTLPHHFILILGQLLQQRQKASFPTIPHGDHSIAPQAKPLRSPHRRTSKRTAKFFFTHLRHPLEVGIH